MFEIFEDNDLENVPPTAPQTQQRNSYESDRKQLEEQIAKFTQDDIFPLCQKYLNLIKDNEGEISKTYKNALFRVVKMIAESPKHLPPVRSNIDYLKYWLFHINFYETEDQNEFFQYMNSKSIGLTQPLFYIGWATCLEHLDNVENAEKLYQVGLKRAKDTRLIEKHYADFQKRVQEEEQRRERERQRIKQSKKREKHRMKLHQVKSEPVETSYRSTDEPAVVYDRSVIYTTHGEYQFEELRAMLPKYQIIFKPIGIFGNTMPAQSSLFVHDDDDESMEIEADDNEQQETMMDEHIIHSKIEDENIINHSRTTAMPSTTQPIMPPVSQTETTSSLNRARQSRSRVSEVTLFTKNAFNEINSMFCGSLDTTEEIFFEQKKQRQQQKEFPAPQPQQPVSQSLFQIHEDNTQDIQQAIASSRPAPERTTIPDKENAPKTLRQITSRRSSVLPSFKEAENRAPPAAGFRRQSQIPAPSRMSNVRRLSVVQQQQLALNRRSSRVSLATGDVYLDDDPNESLYLDTDTTKFNHDLSETINFNDVMSGKDAVLGIVPLLQQVLQRQTQQSSNKTVNPYDIAVMDQLQQYLIAPYAENDRRFSDERSKEEPFIPSEANDDERVAVQLGTREYIINGMLGEGAYALVYAATQQQVDGRLSEVFAIKIQSPACPWEFYICDQLQRRADVIFSEKFIKAWRMFLYDKKSFLVLPYSGYGTLLDVINARKTANKAMEEVMVMYYTIELLKIVNELHSCQIIHGDIKPDNFLIMNEDSGTSEEWKREGSPSWTNRGLILIDFGRSIDMSLYPSGTKFFGDHGASSFKCIEMQTGRPWTYQADLYGICGVVHTMLFNKYMEVEQRTDSSTGKNIWTIKEKFKRYHSKLWQEFFEVFLNIPDCDTMPNLKKFQEKFEDYIVEKKWERLIRGLWAKQFISQ